MRYGVCGIRDPFLNEMEVKLKHTDTAWDHLFALCDMEEFVGHMEDPALIQAFEPFNVAMRPLNTP